MDDLFWGITVLAVGSGVLFVGGFWLGRVLEIRLAMWLGVAVSVSVAAYFVLLSDNILLAAILPFSNLIVVGNWIPLASSFLAGLAWSLIPRQEIRGESALALGATRPHRLPVLTRRLAVVLLLQSVGWLSVVRPIWGTPPQCGDRWENGFCLQTTDSTCTAACAATLLKAHGIAATEQEMARLCLTRQGTLWQGLYRGLRLKTAGTSWDVAIVKGPFDQLRTLGNGPAILAAGVPRDAKVAKIYTGRYGWTPGDWHSVLFFGFRGDGNVAMGDPTPGIGRENWTETDLRVLWRGRGMRLVPRH